MPAVTLPSLERGPSSLAGGVGLADVPRDVAVPKFIAKGQGRDGRVAEAVTLHNRTIDWVPGLVASPPIA